MTRVQIVRSVVVAALVLGLAVAIGVGLWPNGDAERFDRAWAALEARDLDRAPPALESGETEAAVPLLENFLTRCPHEFRDRYRLAQAYRRLGREKDAERELQAYEESQKLYRALTDLNTQAIQEPENAAVRRELAALCRRLGKRELAEVWERAAQNMSAGAER